MAFFEFLKSAGDALSGAFIKVVGGKDASNNAQALKVDSGGSAYTVVGGAAKGSTAAGNATTENVDANTQTLQISGAGVAGTPAGKVVTVQGVTGGTSLSVQLSAGGGVSVPQLINLFYDASVGSLVSQAWNKLQSYTVPNNFTGHLIRFGSFQAETGQSRIVSELNLGSHNTNTNVFTDGIAFTSPQWSALVQGEVTTAIQSGGGNVVLTVTYVNQIGTTGRTGTITIPRGSVVGTKWGLVLQAGDLGVSDVTAVSASPTGITGIVALKGLVALAFHKDDANNVGMQETIYQPGAITIPEGTIITVEFLGGTVSKVRTFDVMIQVVPD